jgi:hypothetical protein
MGRPEWALADELTKRDGSSHRCHDRRDPRLLVAQRRQQARHSAGKEPLARARRPDHRHAVAAGKSQFEGAPRLQLATDFGQIRNVLESYGLARGEFGSEAGPASDAVRQLHAGRPAFRAPSPGCGQQLSRLDKGFSRHDFDSAGQPGFLHAFGRNHDATQPSSSQYRDHWQHARYGPQLAAQRQLAQDRPPTSCPNLFRADEDSERNRQVKRSPAFAQFGRGEVYGDPPGRVVVAAVADGAANSLAGFLQGRVRQADDGETRQPRSDVHLDTYEAAVEAVQSGRKQ